MNEPPEPPLDPPYFSNKEAKILTFVIPSLFLATVSDCKTHCSTRFLSVSTRVFSPEISFEGNSVAVWKKLRSGQSRLQQK